jgi:hypothetical protein
MDFWRAPQSLTPGAMPQAEADRLVQIR